VPGGQPLRRDGLQQLQLGVIMRGTEPMCSICRDPRWQEYTLCTAMASDAVLTVRTYGTGPLYGP